MRSEVALPLRGALVIALAVALPATAASAARDPVAEAQARVTAAQHAADAAAARYSDAQARASQLQDAIDATRHAIESDEAERDRLVAIARRRAVAAYERGLSVLDPVLSGGDILDAARRSTLLDSANANGDDAMRRLVAVTSDLRAQQTSLTDALGRETKAVDDMRHRAEALDAALSDAQRAQRALRDRLARERRARDVAVLLAAARAAAGSSNARVGEVIGSGSWICPVQGPAAFTDTWGAPRPGGRRHQGVDMMSPRGTPVVAAVAGTTGQQTGGAGGNATFLHGGDGNDYYYAHLESFVGPSRGVQAGEVIGLVGNTGDAAGGPTHLHFEIHPGRGAPVDPYPTVRARC